MYTPITRRRFFGCSGAIAGGAALAGALAKRSVAATSKKPGDFMIVEGHRDIWELSDRFKLRDKSQWSPMQDFTVPRLIEGGLSVVIMPATGGSVEERNGREQLLDGGMRVIDMLLMEIEKCGDKASILRTKADLPAKPNKGRVQFFLDIEGGATIQGDPEPNYHPDRSLALLRDFYRLGVRGMQLTHNGRNMLGQGVAEGKEGNRLSAFGVEVVKEMNRLGMMIGVSHLSAKGLLHVAEITKQPIVSSHQNINPFIKTPLELTEPEIKAVAGTGGIVGIRYIAGQTPYKLLVDEIEYLAKDIGVEHIGVGWLGHDKGHPAPGFVPGHSTGKQFSGVEAQSMYEHWDTFIQMLSERGFTDDQINLIVGGNYIRIWKQILPD